MKKLLLGILLILAVDVGAFAQCVVSPPPGVIQQTTFRCEYQVTGTETDTLGVLGGPTVFALTVVPTGGGISGITTAVSGSTGGGFTTIATSTTVGVTINFTGTYTAVRVALTITGGGGVPVDVTLSGSTSVDGTSSGGQPSGAGCVAGYVAYYTSVDQLGCDSSLTYTANGGPLTTTGRVLVGTGTALLPSLSFGGNPNTGLYDDTNGNVIRVANNGSRTAQFSAGGLSLLGNNLTLALGAASDVILNWDAANTLALRNGVNAQTFRLYQTTDGGSNFAYASLGWTSTTQFTIDAINGSGGTGSLSNLRLTGANLSFATGNTDRWTINSTGVFGPQVDNTYALGSHSLRVATANIVALNDVSTINATNGGTVQFFGGNFQISTAGQSFVAPATGGFQFTSRATMASPADGILVLQNNLLTDFNRLQFGGTTSSFPALKRNAAAIDFRLADDSNYADINANTGSFGQFNAASTKFQVTNATGAIGTYRNIVTVAGGIPAIYGIDSRAGLTSADGAAITLYTTVNGTSVFRITADIFATASVTGTAIYTLTWTQNATTQTLVVNSTTLNTLATATDLINPDNATNITARLTGTFTGTFNVNGLVEQIK